MPYNRIEIVDTLSKVLAYSAFGAVKVIDKNPVATSGILTKLKFKPVQCDVMCNS